MAVPELSAEAVAAGREYYEALRTLGMHPEGVFWAYDEAADEQALILLTSLYDMVGPYEVSKLLIKAYNLSATPQDVSPFIVQVHGPTQDVAIAAADFCRNLKGLTLQTRIEGEAGWAEIKLGEPVKPWVDGERYLRPDPHFHIEGTALTLYVEGFIHIADKPLRVDQRKREWARFSSRVNALAA